MYSHEFALTRKKRRSEEEEQEIDEAFILPPSTAPAALLRAGRKRAPTMKALEAEKAPKRQNMLGEVHSWMSE
jgi:hypothetical protein